MNHNLEEAIAVDFDNLGLDPNNPRLGISAPGYHDPEAIFGKEIQTEVHNQIKNLYKDFDGLKEAILAQGWMPIDAILVWRHHKKDTHFIVVEGNTRTTALRQIREDLTALEADLGKLIKRKADKDIIEAKEAEIERHQAVVKATNKLTVVPVKAKDAKELEEILPRILGVRHIKHPQQWGPYPQNLFILKEYQKRFKEKKGNAKLSLDDKIIEEVAGLLSEDKKETRIGIQSAYAFNRFKQRWAEKLPANDEFLNEDHYFFDQILRYKYTKTQFKFDDSKLELDPDMEEVLFKWAFSKPRKGIPLEDRENVFHKAENMRDWNRMATYDAKKKTAFATQLDVTDPNNAPPIRSVYAEFLAHQAAKAPTNILTKLIKELDDLPSQSLVDGAEHTKMLLDKIIEVSTKYRQMITAVESKSANKTAK